MKFYETLQDVNCCVVLLVFFMAIIVRVKVKNFDSNYIYLFFILLLSAFIEAFSTVVYHFVTSIDNTLGIYNMYYFLVFMLFFLLFNRLLEQKYKILILTFAVIYTITSIAESTNSVNILMENQTYPYILASMFLSIIVILYFIKILKDGSVGLLVDNLYFWMSCGVLLYYLVNVPFRVVMNIYTFGEEVDYLFFIISACLKTILFALIGIGHFRFILKK